MRNSSNLRLVTGALAAAWFGCSSLALAQSTSAATDKIDAGSQGAAAIGVSNNELALAAIALLEKQMAAKPTARVPLVLRHEARCVAVFPQITKAGLIIAGKSGRGLVSCRQAGTGQWGTPVFYTIASASIGLQAGIQHSSLLLLVVDEKGVNDLLAESMSLGSEASVAAGPVGLEGGVKTGASILSYSRAEGVFAGIDVGGSTTSFDTAANAQSYGAGRDARTLLFSDNAAPGDLGRLRDTLNKFAPRAPTGS